MLSIKLPKYDTDTTADALRPHIGKKMRLVDVLNSDPLMPYVNPLVGTGPSRHLSGTDFILEDVMAVSGGVELLVKDCGTGERWRMCIIVPSPSNESDFNIVADEDECGLDDKRDDNLQEVFG